MLRRLAQLDHQSGKHAAARTSGADEGVDAADVADDERVATTVDARRAQPVEAVP